MENLDKQLLKNLEQLRKTIECGFKAMNLNLIAGATSLRKMEEKQTTIDFWHPTIGSSKENPEENKWVLVKVARYETRKGDAFVTPNEILEVPYIAKFIKGRWQVQGWMSDENDFIEHPYAVIAWRPLSGYEWDFSPYNQCNLLIMQE